MDENTSKEESTTTTTTTRTTDYRHVYERLVEMGAEFTSSSSYRRSPWEEEEQQAIVIQENTNSNYNLTSTHVFPKHHHYRRQQQPKEGSEGYSRVNGLRRLPRHHRPVVSSLSSPWTRVRGCTATVHVQTTLVVLTMERENEQSTSDKSNSNSNSDNCYYGIRLDGTADGRVSSGLVALLSRVFAGSAVSAYDILRLEPNAVADELRLRHVLTRGRNDGLANISNVVQSHIRNLLRNELQWKSDPPLSNDSSDTNPIAKKEEEPFNTNIITTINDDDQDDDDKVNKNSKQQRQRQGPRKARVAMLLSGGVDSSVALHLLKQRNYDVTAFYLKIWLEDEVSHLAECPWEDDYRTCRRVCDEADVPLETLSLQDEYYRRVVSYAITEARRGRTPNPDVLCNARIKFGCFVRALEGRGFDHVASGHYAQLVVDQTLDDGNDDDGISKKRKRKRLFRAPDPIKDQSYFLCTLTQAQLDRVLFPLGTYHKSQVRELAQHFDLPNKHRPDSQGLCFLGKLKFDEFLRAYLGERPGDIVDARSGEILGRHRGVWYHTVGQRRGIGKVLDPKATARGPWYVVAKDPDHDIVYVSNEYDQDAFAMARSDFYVEDIQWIAGSPPAQLVRAEDGSYGSSRFQMKIRHGPTLVEGVLTLTDSAAGNVKLDCKDGGLAPGQYVALYGLNSSECFGGGVISERHWTRFLLDREDANVAALSSCS